MLTSPRKWEFATRMTLVVPGAVIALAALVVAILVTVNSPAETIAAAESGVWPSEFDLDVGESRSYTLQNGQSRTVTLVSYQRVISRHLIKATVRVDGGGKSDTHTIDVTHAGVPVAINGVWVHGYAWKEADDNGFEDVGRQGGFPLTSGKDVGLAVNDAAYPFYPNLDDYVYPVQNEAFNSGSFLQTWLDPDGWAHSGYDIGTNQSSRLLAIMDGYVWFQYYGGQGSMWITETNNQWSSPCWVFTHIDGGSAMVSNGAYVTKGTPIINGIWGDNGNHTHMGSCGSDDLGSWLFAAEVWNNQSESSYPAPRHWLGLGSYSGSISTNKIASNESGDLSSNFAPEVGDWDISGSQRWEVTDNFVNGVVRVGEVLSDAPYSGYSDRVGTNSVGYIATYIYSPVDYTGSSAVHLKLGATRGARVWVNGDKVHDATESRYDSFPTASAVAIEVDKYDYVLPLKRGWNTLIIKSDHGSRSDTFWGVSPKIGDASGNAISGLLFSTRDTKLSANGGNGSVSLNWSAVDFHSANVDSYKIDIATDAGFNNIVTTVDAGTSTSRSISGLAGSVTYYARVRPYNASALGGSTYWERTDSVQFQTTGTGGGNPTPTPTQPASTPTPTASPSPTQSPPTDVLPAQSAPGGLQSSQIPMFVLLGSDDNNRAGGMEFFVDAFEGRTNPSGNGNPATFDGEAAAMSFYIIGTNIYGPNISSNQWRDQYMSIYENGHELGNHGFHGLANNASRGTINNWLNNWMQPTQDAIEQMFVAYGYSVQDAREAVRGYRAAQDVIDPAMYDAIEAMGYDYGNSSVTNHSSNQPAWFPGTLDNGWPGGATWDNRDFGDNPDVWEIPQTYNSGNSRYCDKDWFERGDSGADWRADMQETFTQLYNGNRAPFSLCLHSQDWGPTNTIASGGVPSSSQLERQQAMNDLLDWLLSGQFPDVRVITHNDLLQWMKSPVALNSQPGATPTPQPTATSTNTPQPTTTSVSTTPTSTVVSAPSPSATPDSNIDRAGVVFSYNPLRTGSNNLEGAEIDGMAYIWAYPDDGLHRVAFYLDDSGMAGIPHRTESVVPYDFEGTSWTGDAQPFDTRSISDGDHTITILVTLPDGSDYVETVSFAVNNDGSGEPNPTPTPIPTPVVTPSPTPTAIPTATATAIPTATATPTPVVTPSPTPTAIPTVTATTVSTPTQTPEPTATVVPTASATPSPTAVPTLSMHVADIDGVSFREAQGKWSALVTITVLNENSTPVPNTLVTGVFDQRSWSTGPVSCLTGLTGQCALDSGVFPNKSAHATLRVIALDNENLDYLAEANSDPDSDSDGTSIELKK